MIRLFFAACISICPPLVGSASAQAVDEIFKAIVGEIVRNADRSQQPVSGHQWLIIASRDDANAGIDVASTYTSVLGDLRVMTTSNGRFAVVAGHLADEKANANLAALKSLRIIPDDSFFVDGDRLRQTVWRSNESGDESEIVRRKTFRSFIIRLQSALSMEGLYTGEVDGAIGPQTSKAFVSYLDSRSVHVDRLNSAALSEIERNVRGEGTSVAERRLPEGDAAEQRERAKNQALAQQETERREGEEAERLLAENRELAKNQEIARLETERREKEEAERRLPEGDVAERRENDATETSIDKKAISNPTPGAKDNKVWFDLDEYASSTPFYDAFRKCWKQDRDGNPDQPAIMVCIRRLDLSSEEKFRARGELERIAGDAWVKFLNEVASRNVDACWTEDSHRLLSCIEHDRNLTQPQREFAKEHALKRLEATRRERKEAERRVREADAARDYATNVDACWTEDSGKLLSCLELDASLSAPQRDRAKQQALAKLESQRRQKEMEEQHRRRKIDLARDYNATIQNCWNLDEASLVSCVEGQSSLTPDQKSIAKERAIYALRTHEIEQDRLETEKWRAEIAAKQEIAAKLAAENEPPVLPENEPGGWFSDALSNVVLGSPTCVTAAKDLSGTIMSSGDKVVSINIIETIRQNKTSVDCYGLGIFDSGTREKIWFTSYRSDQESFSEISTLLEESLQMICQRMIFSDQIYTRDPMLALSMWYMSRTLDESTKDWLDEEKIDSQLLVFGASQFRRGGDCISSIGKLAASLFRKSDGDNSGIESLERRLRAQMNAVDASEQFELIENFAKYECESDSQSTATNQCIYKKMREARKRINEPNLR